MSKYSEIAPKDQEKLKEFLGELYTYVKVGDDVLDVGCSTGYFGKLLIETKGCHVDGVEIDPEDAAKAKQILSHVYSFDLDLEWPKEVYNKKYDVIFFGDVIEHLKYPEQSLRSCLNLLKNGGRLLISTPNIAHISTRLELLTGNFNYESTGILDNTHLRLFTRETLEKLASDSGYKIVDIDYSLVDFSPAVVNRTLKNIGLKSTPQFFEFINRPEARAYQYKLVLQALGKGEKPAKIKPPLKPIQQHDVLGEEIIDLRSQNTKLLRYIDELSKALDASNKALTDITNSKSWKLMTTAKKPYNKLVNLTKNKQ